MAQQVPHGDCVGIVNTIQAVYTGYRHLRKVGGDGLIETDLAAFAQPYLSRLWARLHGRDVWQEPCHDVDDVRALLDGVARSVSLDHRQRIKSMLELQVAG